MTVDGLGSGPGGLSISQLCFCLLEAEDPRERRQPAAPASQLGAQSSALPPQAAHPSGSRERWLLGTVGAPPRGERRLEVQCFG